MASSSLIPLHVFRFQVDFFTDSLSDDASHEQFQVCSGAFAECTGLEATMEPKTIKEGGRNYGAAQRAGGTTFSFTLKPRFPMTAQSAESILYDYYNPQARASVPPARFVVSDSEGLTARK